MMTFRLSKYLLGSVLAVFIYLLSVSFPFLEFNNDHWLAENNEFQQQLTYLEKEFQPGFSTFVVLKFPNSYFSEQNIDFFRSFKSDIEDIPYVFKVNSPLDATVIISDDDLLSIQTYDEAISQGFITDIDHYSSLFINSPYFGKLMSNDYKYVGISVSIDKKNDGDDLNRRVSSVTKIQDLLKTLPDHIDGFISGDAEIYYQMDQATQKNLMVLLPLAFFLLLLVAKLFLKRFRSVAIILLPTLINLGVVPIVIVLLGHAITIINVTLFILVLVITVADGIHMLNYWENYTLNGSKHPIADTIRATWLPCFITSITTAVGFGSFATSSIIPLFEYGIQSFVVMSFGYIIVMSFVPFLLKLIPPPVKSKKDVEIFAPFNRQISKFIKQSSKKITIAVLLFTFLLAQALWFAKTETSFISVFFHKDHVVQQNVETVDNYLEGSGRLDLILTSNDTETFKQIDVFNQLTKNIEESLTHDLIESAQSIALPVQLIHRAFDKSGQTKYPQSSEALEQELLFLEFSRGETKTDVLSSVVDFNYQNSRIEFTTDQLPTYKIKELIAYLEDVFSDWQYGEVVITGSQFLSFILGKYVLQSQFVTVIITLSFVWILFISLFGIRLGSVGMFPNIIPMAITLSLLPITNTPFDFATVLISSVTLGLCVDDTIHWLHYFRISKDNKDEDPSIRTSQMMFKPLLLTSVILGIGFGVLAMADLVILQKFGIFTTLAIGLAWTADIVVLPAIIRTFKLNQSVK